jgi:hypothetical protein
MSQVVMDFHRGSDFEPSREGVYVVWRIRDPGSKLDYVPLLGIWDGRHWLINDKRVPEILYWGVLPDAEKLRRYDQPVVYEEFVAEEVGVEG